jgi:NAD(P)-dependent dehydrogenase (short-subunit alcohol dehydrogenase family)
MRHPLYGHPAYVTPMRILLIGATGTIGQAVAAALTPRHDVLLASHSKSELAVDIARPDSIRTLYAKVGTVDAIISAAGPARFKPLPDLTDDDFAFSLQNKLMGQVNMVRYGFAAVRDGGSITITSGSLSREPMVGSAAVSLVNAGLEGFGRAAALEAPRGIRVNVVAPPWVTETLKALGMPLEGGLPATTVAQAYVRVVEGRDTGRTVSP